MAENNEVTGGGYDVPTTDGIYTPEQASAAIDKLTADWMSNSNHPLQNANHPQNKAFNDVMRQLWKIKCADMDERPKLEQLKAEALDEKSEQEANFTNEAQEISDELESFGWAPLDVAKAVEVGGPIIPIEMDCLKMLRCVERAEWDVIDEIDKAIEQHPGAPSRVDQAISQLKNLIKGDIKNINPEDKRYLALVCLDYIRSAGRRKAGLGDRKEPEGQGEY